ncbi:hypothetical protein ACP70R_038011 [Stipagrostis hirtigluma subsp. patula]
MASPTRPPPPPPAAVENRAPSYPPSRHPAVDPSLDGPFPPESPAPAPPPASPPPPPGPTTTSPPHRSGDSSPASPPQPPMPPQPTTDPSPPLVREDRASPPRSPSPPVLAPPPPPPPPPPAPASSEARSEQEAAESASESGSMTLALALTQTEESVPPTPPKPSSAEASPTGSPRKESALTIAKLLSGEDLAAAEGKPAAAKLAPTSDTGSVAVAAAAAVITAGGGGSVGSKRWLLGGGVPEKVRRAELRRAELGFRVSAAVFCLVSLSVMAADTTPGWSGDSFRRYNEYRYTLAASVIAFTYSGFQLVAEVYYLVTGRHIIRAPWRSYFNLAMDQMLAYLLLSASSAALSRNDVWMSRFGGDQFTKLVNASASMAFLAFISLGLSAIISAYCVFNSVS